MNSSIINRLKPSFLLVIFTTFSMLPQFYMRKSLDNAWFFYNHFTTYFGDIWYVWNNYLHNHFPYPREYPSLFQLFFILISKINGVIDNYSLYANYVLCLLISCGVACTLLLWHITHNWQRITMYWLLAPSFLFYALLNMDLLPILTIILAYYCFIKKHLYWAMIFVAIGAAFKVFPVFLLPIYLLAVKDNSKRLKMIILCVFCWLAINLPFMLHDFGAWQFPYSWQLNSNFARTSSDGSWTWLVFKLLDKFGYGNFSGKISLLLFVTSYVVLIFKYKELNLERKLLFVMLLFILTDRVYSPQYNLYLLPFLVLVDYKVDWRWFYLLEIPNFMQVFFCFFLKNHPALLQTLLVPKYVGLILILFSVVRHYNRQKRASTD